MARHLPRLTEGLTYVLDNGMFSRGALSMLQPKSPAMDMTAAMQVCWPEAPMAVQQSMIQRSYKRALRPM